METKVDTSVTINGIKYVPESQGCLYTGSGDIKIVVLQRGHVLVGILEKEGSQCRLHNASVIRKWGTSKGLGEIAQDGPKSGTKLDKCNGTVEFDYLTVIFAITCKEASWKRVL